MTKREAAIIAAYTGVLIGNFSDMHEYIEEKLGRPVFTHELAFPPTWEEIRAKCKEDFTSIVVE